jgi:RES domain-containing protein
MPDSGAGAARTGGRFNPVGTPALYTSFRLQTAWLEAQQGFPFKAQPMTVCAYEVDCEDILDLTDASIRAAHEVEHQDLSCAWKDQATQGRQPPSWALARRLGEGGVAGIIVPSFARNAAANDVNAVFWTWNKRPPHQVRVIDDEARLPADGRSWR